MPDRDQLYSISQKGGNEEIEFVKLKYAIINNKLKFFGFILSGFLIAFL